MYGNVILLFFYFTLQKVEFVYYDFRMTNTIVIINGYDWLLIVHCSWSSRHAKRFNVKYFFAS